MVQARTLDLVIRKVLLNSNSEEFKVVNATLVVFEFSSDSLQWSLDIGERLEVCELILNCPVEKYSIA